MRQSEITQARVQELERKKKIFCQHLLVAGRSKSMEDQPLNNAHSCKMICLRYGNVLALTLL